MEWRNTESLPPEERANSEFLMLSFFVLSAYLPGYRYDIAMFNLFNLLSLVER